METFNAFGGMFVYLCCLLFCCLFIAEINRLAKLALKTSTTEDKKIHKVLLSRKEKEDEDDYGKTRLVFVCIVVAVVVVTFVYILDCLFVLEIVVVKMYPCLLLFLFTLNSCDDKQAC